MTAFTIKYEIDKSTDRQTQRMLKRAASLVSVKATGETLRKIATEEVLPDVQRLTPKGKSKRSKTRRLATAYTVRLSKRQKGSNARAAIIDVPKARARKFHPFQKRLAVEYGLTGARGYRPPREGSKALRDALEINRRKVLEKFDEEYGNQFREQWIKRQRQIAKRAGVR